MGLSINDSVYSSVFFFLTGLHFFHLVVGLLLLSLLFWSSSFPALPNNFSIIGRADIFTRETRERICDQEIIIAVDAFGSGRRKQEIQVTRASFGLIFLCPSFLVTNWHLH